MVWFTQKKAPVAQPNIARTVAALVASSANPGAKEFMQAQLMGSQAGHQDALMEQARAKVQALQEERAIRNDPMRQAEFAAMQSGTDLSRALQFQKAVRGETEPLLVPNDDEGNALPPATYAKPDLTPAEESGLYAAFAAQLANLQGTGKSKADDIAKAAAQFAENRARLAATAPGMSVDAMNRTIAPFQKAPYLPMSPVDERGQVTDKASGSVTNAVPRLLETHTAAEDALAAERQDMLRHRLATEANTRRGQNMVDARQREQIGQEKMSQPFEVTGADGKPLLVQQNKRTGELVNVNTRGPAGTVAPKTASSKEHLTESEAKGSLYYSQMSGAREEISRLVGFDVDSLANQMAVRAANRDSTNWLAPEKAQQYNQAAQQWAEAYLRVKTGAAATEGEVKNNARTFFPQPGDSVAVINQKNRMRTAAEADVGIVAGRGRSQVDDRRAAGARGASPSVGTVKDGYRFKGGDPAVPANWEQVR